MAIGLIIESDSLVEKAPYFSACYLLTLWDCCILYVTNNTNVSRSRI